MGLVCETEYEKPCDWAYGSACVMETEYVKAYAMPYGSVCGSECETDSEYG